MRLGYFSFDSLTVSEKRLLKYCLKETLNPKILIPFQSTKSFSISLIMNKIFFPDADKPDMCYILNTYPFLCFGLCVATCRLTFVPVGEYNR